ncbi:hypothetical protein [Castellaniella sp.]|uniref:hypothetical protein n=1 Tax=Castellaniella sp. TaxID=1955812 RepID=UPI002AFF0A70|nr:hypothetical protein [Castellaniella sp.]
MATTETWVSTVLDDCYATHHALIRSANGNYSLSSGMGPLDRAVLVSQGDFRLFLEADVARALGAQLIAAADHYEAQRREAQS